jgi:hypothetical protein
MLRTSGNAWITSRLRRFLTGQFKSATMSKHALLDTAKSGAAALPAIRTWSTCHTYIRKRIATDMWSRTLRQSTTATAPIVVPPQEPATAGPWQLAVVESVGGADALATLQETNDGNEDPREGLGYLLIRVEGRNESDVPRVISTADFAAAGPDGAFRRAASLILPEPALEATVAPGKAAEGWVAFSVPADNADGTDVVVRYDSSVYSGVWSDALFAVVGEPALPEGEPADVSAEAGASPDAPAGLEETVVSGGWAIAALEVITGQEVFDRAPQGTRALGEAGSEAWLAVRVRVNNVTEHMRYFSPTALSPAAADGAIVDDAPALTPPIPDVAGEYLPGATGDGWIAWDTSERPYALLRADASALANDPRFLILGNAPAPPSGGESAEAAPLAVSVGDTVVVTETEVNLRASPTTSGEIVVSLDQETELVVTGEPVTADGYRWYPVEVVETGEAGFIVQEFIAAA